MTSFRTSIAAVAFTAVGLLATNASAQQTQQLCHSASIPATTTNWNNSVSVPRFDPALGTLQSIQFELSGTITGSARVESLDNAAANVSLAFQGQLTLTRPDLTQLVVVLPAANFNNTFTAFDGTIDFGGSSGATYPAITATQQNSATSPPPASDLVLFTGPIGNPGNIVLPVTAAGTSVATGAGNIISQFQQQAEATVRVCYNYVPNVPPTFTCPGLQMASVGVPMSFQICAQDVDPTDVVTLSVGALPAGATLTPALPTSGNPVCATFNWTPASNQVGNTVVVFTATDTHNRTATCTVTIASAECHMLFGAGAGASQQTIFGHLYDTQLAGLRRFYPVTMEDFPTFNYDLLPSTFTVQIVMYNPLMFPTNPSQWSKALRVDKNINGGLTGTYSGTENGLGVRTHVFMVNGQKRVNFPFTVEGM